MLFGSLIIKRFIRINGYLFNSCHWAKEIVLILQFNNTFKQYIIDFHHCLIFLLLDCLFVSCLGVFIPLENFSFIWRRHHYRWRGANFYLCSALMAIEQWKIFNVPHVRRTLYLYATAEVQYFKIENHADMRDSFRNFL